jgi:hypothetical protein
VLALFVCAGTAWAEGEPPWSYIEAGYTDVSTDSDFGDDDGDGWFASAYGGGKSWHSFLQYAESETDNNIELTQWYVGVGWHGLLGEKADLFADVAYVDSEISSGGTLGLTTGDESGYFGRVGIRWRLIKMFELGASSRYQDLGDFDDDVVWNANAILYLGRVGIGLQAEIADDIDTYNAFLRFNLK